MTPFSPTPVSLASSPSLSAKTSLNRLSRLGTGLMLGLFSLLAGAAPTVTLTSPGTGWLYNAPAASIPLRATAVAEVGATIARVEFRANGNVLSSDSTAAYAWNWSNVPAGTYVLTAKAIDSLGQESESAPQTLQVSTDNQPPKISLSAPADKAIYALPANLPLVVSTSDIEKNGKVAKVEFFANGVLIATLTQSPWSTTWANPAAGTYTLTAKATDNLGAQTDSVLRTVTVNASNTPPTVSLSAPANNTKYLASANVTLTASAKGIETNTPISKVEFLDGATVIATLTAAPYTYTWVNPAPRAHSITAKATDSAGGVGTSTVSAITVTDTNTPPTVSLSTPANNSKYLLPASLTVSASASGVEANTPITQVEFYANGALIGSKAASPYSIAWVSPPAGTYVLTAKATDSAGGVTTSTERTVTITASDTPPTVTLSSPTNNAKYLASANVTLTASASGVETNTPVSKVEFLDGAAVIATLTAAPYTYVWINPPAGAHSITARATDSAGAIGTSVMSNITVTNTNTPPTVTLSAPANNAKYFVPASLTVSASASGVEANTPITQVEFYANGALIGSKAASPYSVVWASPAAGIYTLTAIATDSAGGVTTSAARMVTVTASDTPPTVSLSAPANNAKYLAPANVTLTASASGVEANTPITLVEFMANGNVIGTATASPYTFVWSPVPAGTYSLTVRATDSAGATTTSVARTITVGDTNLPPTVSLTAPANNARIAFQSKLTISASASAPEANDSVTQVEFYQGTTLIGSATASPWQIDWTPPTAGIYTLTAKATDARGASATSAARTLTVLANQLPSVSLTSPTASQNFTAPATITLSASASDPEGTLTKVEFYQGTTLLGSTTQSPYTVIWANVPEGNYSLTAKAIDNGGGEMYSAAISITVVSGAAKLYYLHTDHLDTPRLVTDETNRIVWRNTPLAEPFGMTPPEDDPDGDGLPFTLNLRFPGQYADKETNTNYNGFRDFNPETGRYLQSDPIGINGGINTYGYVKGYPLGYSDPRGLLVAAAGRVSLACLLNPVACRATAAAAAAAVGAACAPAVKKIKDWFFNEGEGAKDAPTTTSGSPSQEWIYGPENDPKINPDGSTKPNTWTTPDNYPDRDTATDKLDPFKPIDGRRPVIIPPGTDVQRGNTPGGEGPYNGGGGGNETLIPGGLPPGAVGPWSPL